MILLTDINTNIFLFKFERMGSDGNGHDYYKDSKYKVDLYYYDEDFVEGRTSYDGRWVSFHVR